jgi:hypothetical protein
MEPRFERRKGQRLAACEVPPTLFRGMMNRLESFALPFVAALPSPESRTHCRTSMAGLLSDAERKNAESIASRYDLDRPVIQRLIGMVAWDHNPLIDELNRQVAAALGRPAAVLVFDPSAFPKKGTASVGVQRQWCGRLGKVDNCQVGVYLGDVSDIEHARVDFRLYLPREWTTDRKAPDLLHGIIDPLRGSAIDHDGSALPVQPPSAAANPIPVVEPVTSARLPWSCRFMSSPRVPVVLGGNRYDTSDRSRT